MVKYSWNGEIKCQKYVFYNSFWKNVTSFIKYYYWFRKNIYWPNECKNKCKNKKNITKMCQCIYGNWSITNQSIYIPPISYKLDPLWNIAILLWGEASSTTLNLLHSIQKWTNISTVVSQLIHWDKHEAQQIHTLSPSTLNSRRPPIFIVKKVKTLEFVNAVFEKKWWVICSLGYTGYSRALF